MHEKKYFPGSEKSFVKKYFSPELRKSFIRSPQNLFTVFPTACQKKRGAIPIKIFILAGAALIVVLVVSIIVGFAVASGPDSLEKSRTLKINKLMNAPPYNNYDWDNNNLDDYCDNIYELLSESATSLSLRDSRKALGRIRYAYLLNAIEKKNESSAGKLFKNKYNYTTLDTKLNKINKLVSSLKDSGEFSGIKSSGEFSGIKSSGEVKGPVDNPEKDSQYILLCRELASFYFLLGDFDKTYENLVVSNVNRIDAVFCYRMILELVQQELKKQDKNLGKIADIIRRKRDLERMFSRDKEILNIFKAISEYYKGNHQKSEVLMRTYLARNKKKNLKDNEIACFCAFWSIRSDFKEYQAVRRGYSGFDDKMPVEDGNIPLLIDLGRIYFELGKIANAEGIVARLRNFGINLFAEYGVSLLHALYSGNKEKIKNLLNQQKGFKLLERSAWEELAKDTRSEISYQRNLLRIAQLWDALGETENVGIVMGELASHKENKVHQAYLFYVEALYLAGRSMWKNAEDRLEKLQQIAIKYKAKNGYGLPDLPISSLASLYQFVEQKSSRSQKNQLYFQFAQRLFEKLFEKDTDPAMFAVNAGFLLVQGYIRQGRESLANNILRKIIPLWHNYKESNNTDKIDVFLERDFMNTVVSMRSGIQNSLIKLGAQKDDTLFIQLKELIQHLRELAKCKEINSQLEFDVYKKEAERIEQKIVHLPLNVEEDRKNLVARKEKLFQKVAELGESREIACDDLDIAKWLVKANQLKKAREKLTGKAGYFEQSYLLAEICRKMKLWDKAEGYYQDVRKLVGDERPPLYWNSFLGEGMCNIKQNKFKAAGDLLSRPYGELEPGNLTWTRSLFYRAKAKYFEACKAGLLDNKKLYETLRLFEELIRRFPRGSGIQIPEASGVDLIDRARFYIGKVKKHAANKPEEYDSAASNFSFLCRRIMNAKKIPLTKERKKLLDDCLLNAADSYYNAEKWIKAMDYYQRLLSWIRGKPLSIWVYYRMGKCFDKIGKRVEAENSYKSGKKLLLDFVSIQEINELNKSLPSPVGKTVKEYWLKKFQIELSNV